MVDLASRTAEPAPDWVLLPLEIGALLVSPAWAVFCPVPPQEVAGLRRWIAGTGTLFDLSLSMRRSLEQHGFFSAPRPVEPIAPKLRLQLTNRCNLACVYCCTNSGKPRPVELSTSEWLSLIDEARAFAGQELKIDLLGGEPLLAPNAIEIAAAILDRGHRLTVFTNGALLVDTALAREVAQLQKRGAQVRISLSALSRQLCDSLSGGERFEPLLSALQSQQLDVARLRIDIMLLPGTVDDISRHLSGMRQSVLRQAKVTLGLAFCGGREAGEHSFGSQGQLQAAIDRIALEAGESIAGVTFSPLAKRRDACHCAFGQELSVRSDGMLFGCFRMEEPVARYERGRLAATWQGMRTAPRLARLTETCAGCALVSLCGGGCRSENLLSTGDANVPDCGPWRLRVLSELLAENNVAALEWPATHLRAEATRRGIETTKLPAKRHQSLHVIQ